MSLEEREDVDKAAQRSRNRGNFIDHREEEVCCQVCLKVWLALRKVRLNKHNLILLNSFLSWSLALHSTELSCYEMAGPSSPLCIYLR